MRKSVLVTGVFSAVLVVLTMACAWPASVDAVPAERPASTQTSDTAIEGRVLALASSISHTAGEPQEPPSVSLVLRTDDGLVTVIVEESAQINAADGSGITANEIPLAAEVRVEGRRLSATQFEAAVIGVLP